MSCFCYRIIESKNPAFPKDAAIYGPLGWRTHTVFNPNITRYPFLIPSYILPSFGDLPVMPLIRLILILPMMNFISYSD